MKDSIKVSNSIGQLTGIGTEYLVDDAGNVLVKFQDGNIVAGGIVPGGDETVSVSASD